MWVIRSSPGVVGGCCGRWAASGFSRQHGRGLSHPPTLGRSMSFWGTPPDPRQRGQAPSALPPSAGAAWQQGNGRAEALPYIAEGGTSRLQNLGYRVLCPLEALCAMGNVGVVGGTSALFFPPTRPDMNEAKQGDTPCNPRLRGRIPLCTPPSHCTPTRRVQSPAATCVTRRRTGPHSPLLQ